MASVHLRFNNSMTHFRRRMHIVSIHPFLSFIELTRLIRGQFELVEVSFFVTVTEKTPLPCSSLSLPPPSSPAPYSPPPPLGRGEGGRVFRPRFSFFSQTTRWYTTNTTPFDRMMKREFALIAKRAHRVVVDESVPTSKPRRSGVRLLLRSLRSHANVSARETIGFIPHPRSLSFIPRKRSSPISTTIN